MSEVDVSVSDVALHLLDDVDVLLDVLQTKQGVGPRVMLRGVRVDAVLRGVLAHQRLPSAFNHLVERRCRGEDPCGRIARILVRDSVRFEVRFYASNRRCQARVDPYHVGRRHQRAFCSIPTVASWSRYVIDVTACTTTRVSERSTRSKCGRARGSLWLTRSTDITLLRGFAFIATTEDGFDPAPHAGEHALLFFRTTGTTRTSRLTPLSVCRSRTIDLVAILLDDLAILVADLTSYSGGVLRQGLVFDFGGEHVKRFLHSLIIIVEVVAWPRRFRNIPHGDAGIVAGVGCFPQDFQQVLRFQALCCVLGVDVGTRTNRRAVLEERRHEPTIEPDVHGIGFSTNRGEQCLCDLVRLCFILEECALLIVVVDHWVQSTLQPVQLADFDHEHLSQTVDTVPHWFAIVDFTVTITAGHDCSRSRSSHATIARPRYGLSRRQVSASGFARGFYTSTSSG
ncbi:hypothetical protein D3C86_1172220 [compost metagenome]